MKKLTSLLLVAIVATMGISLSSFVSSADEPTSMKPYEMICTNGKKILVCGANGSLCIPIGTC